jgi:hypothetical protein
MRAATIQSPIEQAREVLNYQADGSRPGRPLSVVFGGGLLAAVSMGLMILLAYRTWYLGEVDADWAYAGIGFLFPIYVLGLFLFSYGYELFDAGRAARLTLVLALMSLAALVVVIALLAVLAKLKAGVSLSTSASGASERVQPHAGSIVALIGDELSGGAPPTGEAESDLWTVRCHACGERFIPLPPNAICPYCGRAAVSAR